MTLQEAAQQALEALEYHVAQTRPIPKTSEAIAALRAALNQSKPLTADETMHLLNDTSGVGYWCEEAHIQRFRAAVEKHHGIA